MKKIINIAILVSLLGLGGCATIMTGTSQPFTVNSNIHKAKVYIDDKYVGETPLALEKLSTKKNHIIRIEADGYMPVTEVIKKETSGWVWGNILLGGLIGLGIDMATGGLYVFEKDNITGNLVKIQELEPIKK